MTPTTLHPSAVRHRAARSARGDLVGGASLPAGHGPDTAPTPVVGISDDERTEVLATPPFGVRTPAPAAGRPFGPSTQEIPAVVERDRVLPHWFVAFLVGAFVAVLVGGLAGLFLGGDDSAAPAASPQPQRSLHAPDVLPSDVTSTAPADRATRGAKGKGGSDAGHATGGGQGSGGSGTDTDPGHGTDTGTDGDPGTDAPSAVPAEGVFRIVSPGTGTRFAGSAIPLEAEAVLPGHDEPVPGEDVHWLVRRDGAVVHEAWGRTASVPASVVLAGSYTVTVSVDSEGVVGEREVSFTVAVRPVIVPEALPSPDLTLDPDLRPADLVVPVTDL